jgi:carbonic anhydrase
MLLEGNRRFVDGRASGPRRDAARLREIAPRQAPFAAFLGCADSRVPVELIFDQGFGDLFVVRLAGNVATPEAIASLEFGVAVLGAKVLYVLGHSSCGAVAAAIQAEPVPGQISTLFQHIRPAVRAANGDLEASIVENVKGQALLLAEASPVIAGLIRQGKVKVAGGVFHLATGKVETIEI